MANINNERLYIYYAIVAFMLAISSANGQQNIIRTCPRPSPPENADHVNWDNPRKCNNGDLNCNQDNGITQYQEYDKIHFACKENYQLVSQLPYNAMSVTCGRDGQWFPKIDELEKCVNISVLRKCNTPDVFRCKSTGRCISSLKKCNCDIDCSDGSDEEGCPKRMKVIYALPTGKKSSGIISSPGYPRAEDYPRQFNCIYMIKTLLSNHIRVDFEEFDLPRRENKKCDDFVQIASVHPQFLTFKKQRKKLQQKNTPIKKCGQNGFGMVYSNDAAITINVALGYGHKNPVRYYRGISLSWQVKNERDFYRALHAVASKRDKSNSVVYPQGTMSGSKKADQEDEKLYTLVLPMVIVCGALSLIFLAFCLVRQMKKHPSKDNCLSSSNGSNKPLSSSMKMTSFTLTENNLAKFDETHFQQQHGGVGQHASRLNSASSSCRRGGGCGGPTTKSVAAGKCGSSQNSDLPRYIMSYDIVPATTNTSAINPQQYSTSINNNNIVSGKNIIHSSLSSASHRSRSNSPPTRNSCSKNSSSTLNSGVPHSNHLLYEQQQQQNNKELQTRASILPPHQHQYSSSQEYTTSNSGGSSHSDNASSSSRPHHYQRADEGVGSCGGTSQSTATCSLCHQRRKNCHGGVGDRFLNYNDRKQQQQNRRHRNSFPTRHHQQHAESSSPNSASGSVEISIPTPTTYSRDVYEQPSLSNNRHHYIESTYPPAVADIEHSALPVSVGDDRRIVEQADTFDRVGFSMKEEEEDYYSDWYPSYNEEYHSQRQYQQQHYPDLYDNSSQLYDNGFLPPHETLSSVHYNNKDTADVMAGSFHGVEKHKALYLEHEICDIEGGRRDGGFMNSYGGDYSTHQRYLMNTDRTLGGSLICTH